MSRFDEARSRGAIAASEEVARLAVDITRPVDIFSIIDKQRLWLVFQPLGNLLGAYRRTPENAGILITTNRQVHIQRLTGAHEYGHHVLGHMSSVDDETDIEAQSTSSILQEVEAQSFALNFLLPPPLVFRLWAFHNYPSVPRQVTREQIYRISLDLGSSYKSTIIQLAAVGKITQAIARQYLPDTPQTIKKAIGHGIGPANSRADIWALDESDNGREIFANTDDEMSLSLQENPSTGYRWNIDKDVMPSNENGDANGVLDLIDDDFEAPPSDLFNDMTGEVGMRLLRFRARGPGEEHLRAELTRPWLQNDKPLQDFNVTVNVQRHPTDGGNGPIRSHLPSAFSLQGR